MVINLHEMLHHRSVVFISDVFSVKDPIKEIL